MTRITPRTVLVSTLLLGAVTMIGVVALALGFVADLLLGSARSSD